jgi:hypothetical protein
MAASLQNQTIAKNPETDLENAHQGLPTKFKARMNWKT